MKIAMPNAGALINQHFGKSESFVILTIEGEEVVNVEELSAKEFAHNHEGIASLLVEHGAETVITGGIGPGAINGLKERGLKVIKGATGEYLKVAEEFIKGTLVDSNVVCNHHHGDHEGHHHH